MRLDLFLKASRLALRRSVAQKLCDTGLVSVNERTAKASHAVKTDDIITIRRGKHEIRVKVVEIPTTRQIARKDAASFYELLSERTVEEFEDD